MKPKMYIASSVYNWSLCRRLISHYNSNGWNVTYDWTVNAEKVAEGVKLNPQVAAFTAASEVEAVLDADLVVVVLPGGFGTYTEVGMTIADAEIRGNKKLLVVNDPSIISLNSVINTAKTKHELPFFHHPIVEKVKTEAAMSIRIGEIFNELTKS